MCIFCKIINKEIPSKIIYEDEKCIAFLDINPTNKGDALIATKEHYETFTDVSDNLLKHCAVIAKKIAIKQKKVFDYTDYNILSNNGKNAGQFVSHFHMHITPRLANDGLKVTSHHLKLEDKEFEEIQKKLKF